MMRDMKLCTIKELMECVEEKLTQFANANQDVALECTRAGLSLTQAINQVEKAEMKLRVKNGTRL